LKEIHLDIVEIALALIMDAMLKRLRYDTGRQTVGVET
jgi:hypothetical protein